MFRIFLITLGLLAPLSSAFIVSDTQRFSKTRHPTSIVYSREGDGDISTLIDLVTGSQEPPTVLLPMNSKKVSSCCSSKNCSQATATKVQDEAQEKQDSNIDVGNMSMVELNRLVLDLPHGDEDFVLQERASLEEARHMVWEHIVQAPWSSSPMSPCCAEYPFCSCPKL